MNITELRVENLKRLTALQINPATGTPVVITGDNGAGKSSVLDSILLALSGAGLEDPIRHGASRAVIKLKIEGKDEEFHVERIIRHGSRELKVTSAEGKSIASPQRFLDSLIGAIAFDPLDFVRMKPKQQAETLRSLLGIDTTAIEARKQEAYTERTMVNRQVEALKAQLDTVPEHSADVPDHEVSAVDLVKQRDEITNKRGKLEALERITQGLAENEASLVSRIEKGKALLAQLEADLADVKVRHAEGIEATKRQKAHVESLHPVETITSKIASVDLTNQAVREKRRWKEVKEQLEAAVKRSEHLTQIQVEAEQEKARILKEADLPVPGMEISSDGVTVNGVRFDQLSTAQQITVSGLVAMRSNPKLRIILIREGALINNENTAALFKLASERDYQIWMEKFTENPTETGIHIVDGAIVAS